ncbi:hypothetical protein P154DRAFT_422987 [Amniculicola lignicola CBS 123094]|uniref:Uncharacterized protein n=1 Tax=Amniculicola lignicola CBS 123094 TaxID=1392246 RepID=A0A6A5WX68_9PLEO|nr:hypothetical protein P154DRAFT_422987 [Amniculicola lignicola CBS 123094]
MIPLALFLGGSVIAIPVVTGIAEGVQEQKKQNEEAANETRMIKFNIYVHCEDEHELADDIDEGIIVLRHNKVWVVPRDIEARKPIPPKQGLTPELHAFAGFFIQYPDDERCPVERGLVSTISDDPPVLNWIYVNNDTYALAYGNRTASITHMVGAWDWTDDERYIMLDGFEGFIAVDEGIDPSTEWGKEGLRWAVYFDNDDDGLKKKKGKRRAFEIGLERVCQSAEEQLKQLEDADKKMQVKTRGGLSTQFTAPGAEARMKKKEAA